MYELRLCFSGGTSIVGSNECCSYQYLARSFFYNLALSHIFVAVQLSKTLKISLTLQITFYCYAYKEQFTL